ncbi:MAG: tRNA dihydrouridine synthase DusB [Bacillota bacterium]
MFHIGPVTVPNRLVLAPMAGVTDRAFRLICREHACGLLYTEMLSDKALVYGNARSKDMLELLPAEHPITVQFCGSGPDTMARAAELAEAAGADIVDINMGCPAPKIIRNREGADLMRRPQEAAAIVRAVVRAIRIPVTVKVRRGWDDSSINAVEVARLAVAEGAQAVAVHGRVRTQFYSGRADWGIIRQVAEAVPVPVIGNGDVTEPEAAGRMLVETGCAAVMIGRGCLGNPWLFARAARYLATGQIPPPPTPADRLRVSLQHLHDLVALKGSRIGLLEMRKHAAWYVKGLPGATRVRERLVTAPSPQRMTELLEDYFGELMAAGAACP